MPIPKRTETCGWSTPNVPDSVKDTYVLPPFPTYSITTESEWDDVVAWLTGQGIVETVASYQDSVNPTFLDAIRPADGAGDPAHSAG